MSLQFFRCLPIKENSFLFISFEGKNYNCNPKYLYLELMQNTDLNADLVWAFNSDSILKYPLIENKVLYKSFRFYLALLTCKYIIVNYDLPWFFPKRSNQMLVQTWHGGGAYKKVGRSSSNTGKLRRFIALYSQNKTDLYLSSSDKFTQVQMEATGLKVYKFFNSGMPRNSLLYKTGFCNKTIKKKLLLLNDVNYILYAPTYRGDFKDSNEVDFLSDSSLKLILNAFTERFGGEWKFIVRLHPSSNPKFLKGSLSDYIVDCKHEDMQELLAEVDVLITDYSSSMWDFSLTGRPGFIYAPDIDEYLKVRGLYTSTDSWPYPIASTLNELITNVKDFDKAQHSVKIEKHLSSFVSYENENSALKVLKKMKIL